MKKLFILFILAGLVISCGTDGSDVEKIKNGIEAHKKEIAELEAKITELKAQLPENGVKANKLKVRVKEVERKFFSKYFEATGELEAINEAYISPEVSGQITSIQVEEGQKVSRGQLLAKLNTSLIEKNIEELKTQLNLAETFFNKQSDLWAKGIGSERQYLETKNNYESLKNKLATAQEQYKLSIVTSPISGYVEKIMLKKGELAVPGMQLMRIIDIDKLQVSAMLSESYLPVVNKGDTVTITFPTFPDIVLKEKVSRVSNVVNQQNRTFTIEVEISNTDGRLKPNLLATIKINDYNAENALVVPSLVIREDVKGSYLYVAEQQDDLWMAKKKYVVTGRSYMNETEILSGVTDGELVITDGYSNVSDGTMISITE
ncbi:MAG: efflux RND transporter periplasmic adaptor subunit [Bacteroidetes bacterium]|nr:efflux RND transporter periplasmic adaptor subunit [Bacteroidota bacterium]